MSDTSSPFHAPRQAKDDVVSAARNLLFAIDGFLSENENEWPDMPFGVYCALVILGEKVSALDAEPAEPLPTSPDPKLVSTWMQW